jgi:hypothetical protein
MAGVIMGTMAMIKTGNLRLAGTVADIPAHHPKHLRPTQRKKREEGQEEGRTAEHGVLRRGCV